MSEWHKKTIGEICDLSNGEVQTGPFGSQLHQSDYQSEGYPVVMPKDIVDGRIDESSIARVSISHVERLSKHRLSVGDIVYGRRGDIGRQAIVRNENVDWLCGSGCLRIRLGEGLLKPNFLHLYLQTAQIMSWVENQAIGATMPNLNTKILRSVPVFYPASICEQQQIVAALSAYDDLIENNNRRIALLEKMAEEIYREWFVRLRFPGHEGVAFHKGIPEGWGIKRLNELVTTQYGYTASAESEKNGPSFLRITDIVPSVIDWDSVPYCRISDAEIKKYLLQEGDIVVARTGATVGFAKRINKFHPDSVFASYLVRLKPNDTWNSIFLGVAVESDSFKNFISMFFTGSAQPQANAKVMTFFPLLYPPQDLVLKFNSVIEPTVDQREILFLQNSRLKQTRDRLLTRLISGKLSVEDLDIQFPPNMTTDT